MAKPPVHQLFQPVGGGPVPIGSFSRSTSRGIRFRLPADAPPAPQGSSKAKHFIFEPIGGGPVILGGTGKSKGKPTKITLTGHFVEADDDDD
jgi:hypothetical protein